MECVFSNRILASTTQRPATEVTLHPKTPSTTNKIGIFPMRPSNNWSSHHKRSTEVMSCAMMSHLWETISNPLTTREFGPRPRGMMDNIGTRIGDSKQFPGFYKIRMPPVIIHFCGIVHYKPSILKYTSHGFLEIPYHSESPFTVINHHHHSKPP